MNEHRSYGRFGSLLNFHSCDAYRPINPGRRPLPKKKRNRGVRVMEWATLVLMLLGIIYLISVFVP